MAACVGGGRAASSLVSSAASALVCLSIRSTSALDLVLGREVAVVDVEVLDRFAAGALEVLAELAGDGEGSDVTVRELLRVVSEGSERLRGGQGDRQHGDGEKTEARA